MSDLIVGLIMIVAGLFGLAVFLLPSIIAFKRKHHYKFIILAINLIFGATGIGYLIALIWAVWPQKTALVDVVTNDLTSAQSNQELYRQRGENARAYDTARYGKNVPQPSTLTPPLAATNIQPPATSQQSPLNDQQFKDCPYCGEQIAAKAIKCKHCQTMLTEGRATEPAIQQVTSIDKSKELEDFVVTFHAAHRQTNPVVKKKAALLGGTTHSHVYGATEITDDVLKTHNDYLEGFNPSAEKLLLVINKPSSFGMRGVGGIVLTNQTLYYKLMGGGLVSLKHPKGHLNINAIKSIVIGDSDNAYGGAYNGHELFINGQKVGMLRMGTDMMWDDETLEYTKELFTKLTEKVFLR